jgi:hypothetical protein
MRKSTSGISGAAPLSWGIVLAPTTLQTTHASTLGGNQQYAKSQFSLVDCAEPGVVDCGDAGPGSPSDYLNENMDNPFRCLFNTVDAQDNACPAPPIFNELDSVYNDARFRG